LMAESTEAIQKIADAIRKVNLSPGAGGKIAGAVLKLEKFIIPLKAALAHVALPTVREFLERDKARTGQFDFDDLIVGVVKAIEGPHAQALITALRRRYRFALVDEFQDTDELQWRFFERVFIESNRGHRAYLIGDPKQAIYGFRGGDVE